MLARRRSKPRYAGSATSSAPSHRPRTAPRRARSPSRSTALRGERRPLRAEPHDVLAGEQRPHRAAVPVGQLAGRGGRPARSPCRRTRRRWRAATPARRRARTTTRRARGTRARPSSSRGARRRRAAAAAAAAAPASTVVRRPCTLPASSRASNSDSAITHCDARRPRRSARRCPGGSGTATSASRGAVSSANPPRPSATSAPTRWVPPPSSAARCGRGVERTRRRGRRRVDVASTASTTVRQPVHRHRWAASARSTPIGGDRCPWPRSAAARTMIPGVQNPHCEPPVATNAAASASRSSAGRPSTVVTVRPAIRATGVTHATRALAVDEHGAAAALALRRAAVLHAHDAEPLPQHREQRLARRRRRPRPARRRTRTAPDRTSRPPAREDRGMPPQSDEPPRVPGRRRRRRPPRRVRRLVGQERRRRRPAPASAKQPQRVPDGDRAVRLGPSRSASRSSW